MRRLVLFCAILIFSISTVFRLVLFSVSSIQFEESIEKNGALDINDTQQDKTTLDNEGVHNETIWRKDHHEQEDNDAHIVGYRFKRDDVNRHTNDTTLFQNTNDGNFNPNFMDDFVFSRRPKYFSSKYDRIYGTIHNPCVSTLTPRYERTNVTVSSCEELHLPLKDFFRLPEKCLPRVVLLPSHPVSGNGLTRNLFMHVTGLSTVKLQRPDNIPQKHARIYRLGEDSWNLLTPMDQICKEGLEVPFKSRVALTKTHYPGDNKNMFQELHKTFNDDISNVFVTHVVRLVRNPGDHMIRQSKKKSRLRWDHK